MLESQSVDRSGYGIMQQIVFNVLIISREKLKVNKGYR